MKLAKLSLVALIALGAYSTISAEPLEDAIKNVDISGYLRYRYTNTTMKNKTTKEITPAEANHAFKGIVNFKSAIDDNFFTVVGLRYVSSDLSGPNAPDGSTRIVGDTDVSKPLYVRQALLGYKVGNTTVTAGRQVIGSFFTDNMSATGIKVVNSDIPGLTLAAFAFDDLEKDGDIGLDNVEVTNTDTKGSDKTVTTSNPALINHTYAYQHNLFGAAVQGSYEPVNFQIWAAKLKNVAGLFAGEVGAEFGMFSAKVQGGVSAVNKYLKKDTFPTETTTTTTTTTPQKVAGTLVGLANGHLVDFEVAANVADFDASLGFINYGTKLDKYSLVSFEDVGSFNTAGEQILTNYQGFQGKNNYFYLTAGYTFDKVRVGGDVVVGTTKTALDKLDGQILKENSHKKVKNRELVARLEYAYSKKLNFSSYFSTLEAKTTKVIDADNKSTETKEITNQFRFQAKYSF